eukprot:4139811-Alexandrium_andersonii.AAC.1
MLRAPGARRRPRPPGRPREAFRPRASRAAQCACGGCCCLSPANGGAAACSAGQWPRAGRSKEMIMRWARPMRAHGQGPEQ